MMPSTVCLFICNQIHYGTVATVNIDVNNVSLLAEASHSRHLDVREEEFSCSANYETG